MCFFLTYFVMILRIQQRSSRCPMDAAKLYLVRPLLFIAITLWFTLTQSGNTYYGPMYGSNRSVEKLFVLGRITWYPITVYKLVALQIFTWSYNSLLSIVSNIPLTCWMQHMVIFLRVRLVWIQCFTSPKPGDISKLKSTVYSII